jgi:hypothetical protein
MYERKVWHLWHSYLRLDGRGGEVRGGGWKTPPPRVQDRLRAPPR